jgi:aspartyl-tRNA(Asn)/glutamyl-tRNA(Gln) amidotransferase subunit C
MPLPEIDVRYVADLTRLKLTDQEVERFQKQLGDILGYIEQLQKVDVSGVEATHQSSRTENNLRADEPRPSLPVAEALANAPLQENNLIIVPKMVE